MRLRENILDITALHKGAGKANVSIFVALHHVTHYRYDRLVDARPAGDPAAAGAALPDARSRAIRSRSRRTNHFVNWQQDPHGNWLARFVFPEKTDEFKIEVDLHRAR